MEGYTLEVAVVVAFPVEALEAQAVGLCLPVRAHQEAEALPALLYKVGLSAVKDH